MKPSFCRLQESRICSFLIPVMQVPSPKFQIMDGFYKEEFGNTVANEDWKTVFATCDAEVAKMSNEVEEEVQKLCRKANKEETVLKSLVREENQVLMNVIIERKRPANVHAFSAHYVSSKFAKRMAGLNTPTTQVQSAEQARLDIMALVNNRLHQTGKKLVVEKRVEFVEERNVIMNGFIVRELITPRAVTEEKIEVALEGREAKIASVPASKQAPLVTPVTKTLAVRQKNVAGHVEPVVQFVAAGQRIKGTPIANLVVKNLFPGDPVAHEALAQEPLVVEVHGERDGGVHSTSTKASIEATDLNFDDKVAHESAGVSVLADKADYKEESTEVKPTGRSAHDEGSTTDVARCM